MTPSAAARDAFAIGWAKATARHPVKLTERALLACKAAMRVAEAQPQSSVNATLQLGQLEGIWAVIYARREALEKLHGAALKDVLAAIGDLDWSQIINRVEQYLLLDPSMSGKDLATRIGADVERLISGTLPIDAQTDWRLAMQQALIDATAEGQAVGLSLVGDASGIAIDFDLAATAAKDALATNQVLWDASSGWMATQTHGLGYEISQTLAKLWAEGAVRSDMEDAIMAILDNSRNQAGVILDQAIGQSLSQGALDSYNLAGVQYADFTTAGDGRVCAICAEAEDNNSYRLGDCPQPPLHIGCRCAVAPSDYQPTAGALTLLQGYAVEDLADAA
jgi:hypothetical protein